MQRLEREAGDARTDLEDKLEDKEAAAGQGRRGEPLLMTGE
jgi:hypothetical protein